MERRVQRVKAHAGAHGDELPCVVDADDSLEPIEADADLSGAAIADHEWPAPTTRTVRAPARA